MTAAAGVAAGWEERVTNTGSPEKEKKKRKKEQRLRYLMTLKREISAFDDCGRSDGDMG